MQKETGINVFLWILLSFSEQYKYKYKQFDINDDKYDKFFKKLSKIKHENFEQDFSFQFLFRETTIHRCSIKLT